MNSVLMKFDCWARRLKIFNKKRKKSFPLFFFQRNDIQRCIKKGYTIVGEVTTSHTSHPPARYNKHTRTAQYTVHIKATRWHSGKLIFKCPNKLFCSYSAASLCVILLPISIFWCHYYYLIISSCRWWKASINLPSSKGPLHTLSI
jgi:hypothetical protein